MPREGQRNHMSRCRIAAAPRSARRQHRHLIRHRLRQRTWPSDQRYCRQTSCSISNAAAACWRPPHCCAFGAKDALILSSTRRCSPRTTTPGRTASRRSRTTTRCACLKTQTPFRGRDNALAAASAPSTRSSSWRTSCGARTAAQTAHSTCAERNSIAMPRKSTPRRAASSARVAMSRAKAWTRISATRGCFRRRQHRTRPALHCTSQALYAAPINGCHAACLAPFPTAARDIETDRRAAAPKIGLHAAFLHVRHRDLAHLRIADRKRRLPRAKSNPNGLSRGENESSDHTIGRCALARRIRLRPSRGAASF